ncbi:MAG: hypothetical protein IJX88_06115 [Clostridia bacterium]|nr:hypothetical protein [Clostridia bacterium]
MDIYSEVCDFYNSVTTEKFVVGKSVLGRNIYAVKIGDGLPVGIAQYAIHGREYITAKLAFRHYKRGVQKGSVWLLPLMNPDGAMLSCKGISSVENTAVKKRLITLNGGMDFSLWKANARGVDLNVNFDAAWGKGAKNVKEAGAENFIGIKPFSEKETLALKRFTEKICPDYTVSYHTKGEEIYWYFYQPIQRCVRDKNLALALSKSTGYPLAHAKGSAGGYKDWCIRKFGIPAFTVEAGADMLSHPIGEEGLENILLKNGNALYDLSGAYGE